MKNSVSHDYNVSGIYLIYNTKSRKSYIGSAVNIYNRIFGSSSYSHLKSLSKNRHSNKHLQNAYNKYGVSVFTFRILETCDKEKLLEREQFYLDTWLFAKDPIKFAKKAYNICPTAGSPLGRLVTNSTKQKLSDLRKGVNNPMYGKKGSSNSRSIGILQYSSNGNFISEFSNAREASELLKISEKAIRSALHKGYMAAGYYWKVKNGKILKHIETKRTQKKSFSATCTMSGTILKFNSLAEAAVYFNVERKVFSNAVRKCIVQQKYIYKNYIWKEIN